MKNLGCINSWFGKYLSYPNGWDGPAVEMGEDNPPAEYLACRAAKHPLVEVNRGRCWNQYTCPICGITWDVDSSD
jgi:hypothetical protein